MGCKSVCTSHCEHHSWRSPALGCVDCRSPRFQRDGPRTSCRLDRGAGRGAIRRKAVTRAQGEARSRHRSLQDENGEAPGADRRTGIWRYNERSGCRRAYARKHGVPDTAILLENKGRTTSESMLAVADTLGKRGIKTAILVSDPFHMLRLLDHGKAVRA